MDQLNKYLYSKWGLQHLKTVCRFWKAMPKVQQAQPFGQMLQEYDSLDWVSRPVINQMCCVLEP